MKRKSAAKTKPQWGIFFVTIGLFLLAVYISKVRRSNKIDKCLRYTIAYTTTVGDKKVNYKYSIMGLSLTGYWYQTPRSIKDYFKGDFAANNFTGQRFLVRVNCEAPEINEIDWTHSIPTWVEQPPENGWTVLPVEFKETEFAN